MRIQIEFNPIEGNTATPLMFAQAVIDYWYSDVGFAKNEEKIARANLSEVSQHLSCFLEAEAYRSEMRNGVHAL